MGLIEKASSGPSIDEPLTVGGIRLRNRAFLAPMSGVTDAVFRDIAWHNGAGLVVSEMIASEALVEGDAEMRMKATMTGDGPHMVQLAGREGRWLELAARMAEAQGASIIDINMGCPARRVTTGQCGSALMREPDHALRLIETVVSAVQVPVTVKMRLGWDETSMNAPEIARRAESAGVAMITVHGRTRCQFYKGSADWRMIRRVREQTSVPLVVNGDILDRDTAIAALSQSGADAVMIGRGAYGAPWLPGRIAADAAGTLTTKDEDRFIREVVPDHLDAMLGLYGIEKGIRQARKHIAWYLDRLSSPVENGIRREILTADNPASLFSLLGLALETQDQWQAA